MSATPNATSNAAMTHFRAGCEEFRTRRNRKNKVLSQSWLIVRRGLAIEVQDISVGSSGADLMRMSEVGQAAACSGRRLDDLRCGNVARTEFGRGRDVIPVASLSDRQEGVATHTHGHLPTWWRLSEDTSTRAAFLRAVSDGGPIQSPLLHGYASDLCRLIPDPGSAWSLTGEVGSGGGANGAPPPSSGTLGPGAPKT
jgi:hypothetical protein